MAAASRSPAACNPLGTNSRVLLVGGGGFIGHHLALELSRAGTAVDVVDSLEVNNLHDPDLPVSRPTVDRAFLTERLELMAAAGIRSHLVDANDRDALAALHARIAPDVVVFLAGVAHAVRSNREPSFAFRHSLQSLETTLDVCRQGIRQFVFFSSSLVYGHFQTPTVTEDAICNPVGIYGTLKYAGERLVKAFGQAFDVPYTIIRPSAVYGERCVSRRVVQAFIEDALAGRDLSVGGDGGARLDFTYVDDLVDGVVRTLGVGAAAGETFNITCGESRSVGELVEIVRRFFPALTVRYAPVDQLDVRRGTLAIDKATALLGYRPRFSLERGLERYVQWYLSSRDRRSNVAAQRASIAPVPHKSVIPLTDLRAVHAPIRRELAAAVDRTLDTSSFIGGESVDAFEHQLAAYLGVKHVVSCACGTDAIRAALMALDLPPGSEVITTAFSFVATAEAIRLAGHQPVFVDVDRDTFNMDPGYIAAAIGARTRAILPVHLYGQCADMDAIVGLAERHGLHVIEDAAQALGTDYIGGNGRHWKAGTIGDVGTTSFFPTKNLGAIGDGGAAFTNDDSIAARMRSACCHGRGSRGYERVGFNSRLDALQAAILSVKLEQLDASLDARRRAAGRYDALLTGVDGIRIPHRATTSTHTFHKYSILVDDARDALAAHLHANGVETKVYYSTPIPLEPGYRDCRSVPPELEQTRRICASVLTLPLHAAISAGAQQRVADIIRKFFASSPARPPCLPSGIEVHAS